MLCTEAGSIWKKQTCFGIIETHNKTGAHRYIHIHRVCDLEGWVTLSMVFLNFRDLDFESWEYCFD